MISARVTGSFKNMEAFARRTKTHSQFHILKKYGPIGVTALAKATPKDDSSTANSWYFEIEDRPGYFQIRWLNSQYDDNSVVPVAALIQYGHATGNGGYVQGIDYINPALRPIFTQIANDMWKEVTKNA